MTRRRTTYNPLEPTAAIRWQVIRNMTGAVLESRELPAGTDLVRVFVTGMLERIDAGWQIGEFSSTSATFFCHRGQERRMVSIDSADPHNVPMHGGAHLAGCRNCED